MISDPVGSSDPSAALGAPRPDPTEPPADAPETITGPPTGPVTTPTTAAPRPPRVRELTGSDRVLVWSVLALLAVLPFVGAIVLHRNGWIAVGDVANITMRARDVFSSESPRLGQPTTGLAPDGTQLFQPGPLGYWVLAPFVTVLSSDLGPLMGTAAVASASLVMMAWLAWRSGRGIFVLTAIMLGLFVGTIGVHALVYPLNSTMAILWMPTSVFAAWAVWRGDAAGLPIFVFGTAFSLQNHLLVGGALIPLVPIVAIATIGMLRDPHRRRRDTPVILASALLGLLVWIPTIADATVGTRNLQRLAASTDSGPGVGFAWTAERIVNAIGPLPRFLTASGDHAVDRSTWIVYIAGAVVGALGSLAVVAHRRGVGDVGRLVAPILLFGAGALLVGARSPVESIVRSDPFGWMLPLGLLVWLGFAIAVWALLPIRFRDGFTHRARTPAIAVVAIGVLASITTGGRPDPAWDGHLMPAIGRVATRVDAALAPGTYLVRFEGSPSWLTVSPAILNRLHGDDRVLLVGDTVPTRSVHPPSRIHDGRPVDGIVTIAADATHRLAAPPPADDSILVLGRDEYDRNRILVTLEPSP